MQVLRRLHEFRLLMLISSHRVKRQKKKFGNGSFFEKLHVIVAAAFFQTVQVLAFALEPLQSPELHQGLST